MRSLGDRACRLASLVLAGCLVASAASAEPLRPKDEEVVIKRDTWGTPHVYASSVAGLFHGYGYAAAQDRLFQLEIAKRSFTGTVAEVLGADYADDDADTRANRDPESIQRQYDALSADDRAIFEGYAAGVNAWIAKVEANPARLLPKQFLDFDFRPQRWTGMDVVMIFVGTMANRFSDGTSELGNLATRDRLIAAFGMAKGLQFFDLFNWKNDTLAPTTVPPGDDYLGQPVHVTRNTMALMPVTEAAVQSVKPPQKASNVWLVGKDRAKDAKAILYNGPQFGFFVPAYTYSIGLHGAGFDVVGNTPFAYPVILFGHNNNIGWGATAGFGDTVDIYEEKLDAADPFRYLYKGEYVPMRHRSETVNVRGGAPVTVDVYYTVHGRVTSFNVAGGVAYSKKRTWEGLELASLLGWIESMKAKNWHEWRTQASRMAITINWYYIDHAGNIGYIHTGRYPLRPQSQDVRVPALGTGEMEWLGFLPFEQNPQTFNPRQGYIANWNNKPSQNVDGSRWGSLDHVQVIFNQFATKPRVTKDDIWAMNRTVALADSNVFHFLPFLQAAVKDEPAGSNLRRAVDAIASWNQLGEDNDGNGFYDSPAVTIFSRWLTVMGNLAIRDDVPANVVGGGTSQVLYNALLGAKAGVPQTYDFFNGKDPLVVVRAALDQTLADLTAQFKTSDMNAWLTAVRPHVYSTNNFAGIPQANASERLTHPLNMNRGTESDLLSFANGKAHACEVAPPGQSGFVAPDGTKAAHYMDQFALFPTWRCKDVWYYDSEVDAHTESVETLSLDRQS